MKKPKRPQVAGGEIIRQLREDLHVMRRQVAEIQVYVDKTLNIASRQFDLLAERTARPYFALDNGWGLTNLDSGQPFFINTTDRNITPWILMGGHWEPNVERVLLQATRENMTVLDIGAHFGYYTVKLGSKLKNGGRIHSFEPNPRVNAVCLENIKINRLSGIASLHRCALGDEAGFGILTWPGSNMSSANLVGEQEAEFSERVEIRTLDSVIPESETIDLIKLDAEGYEQKILLGARKTLARSPDCLIVIELNLDRWERGAPLDNLLSLCGDERKRAFAIASDGSLLPMDVTEIRAFLLQCDYHENYFLIGNRIVIETLMAPLLIKK